jgi:HPt (histidine-containing phosphotransfer) domain-containing protein
MQSASQEHLSNISKAIDTDELLGRCMGRIDFMERVLNRFLDASDKELADIEQALESGDHTELARVAHRLSGSALNVSAKPLATKAKQLEQLALRNEVIAGSDILQSISSDYVSIRNQITNRTNTETW